MNANDHKDKTIMQENITGENAKKHETILTNT